MNLDIEKNQVRAKVGSVITSCETDVHIVSCKKWISSLESIGLINSLDVIGLLSICDYMESLLNDGLEWSLKERRRFLRSMSHTRQGIQ